MYNDMSLELPLEGIVEVNQAAQMGPVQLSTQWVDNLLGLEHLAKAIYIF